MRKFEGVHFYININNLNSIIRKDENKNDDLTRTFHALDTFTWALENFVNEFGDIEIEKFTTCRYHFYFSCGVSNNDSKITSLIEIIVFSKTLAKTLAAIGKYQSMQEFTIGIGCDWGQYTEYNFSNTEPKFEEMTTIGAPANRAAKLQSECGDGKVLISKALYDIMPRDFAEIFFGNGQLSAKLALKYSDLTVYEAKIEELYNLTGSSYGDRELRWIEKAKIHANETNLSEVKFSEAKAKLDYLQLSLKNSKWIDNAVILFSDIRGFTNKVDHTDLAKIKQLTQDVLTQMNKAVMKESGIHVQFQGDRESAIFHSYLDEPNNYIVRSITAAMRMLDFVYDFNKNSTTDKLDIGIGCAIGSVFATRIGMRGRKFNVVMGETVKIADSTEDEIAGVGDHCSKTEIAITKEMFLELKSVNSKQSREYEKLFSNRKVNGREYYVCTTGFRTFQENADFKTQNQNAEKAKHNNGIKPWGI